MITKRIRVEFMYGDGYTYFLAPDDWNEVREVFLGKRYDGNIKKYQGFYAYDMYSGEGRLTTINMDLVNSIEFIESEIEIPIPSAYEKVANKVLKNLEVCSDE